MGKNCPSILNQMDGQSFFNTCQYLFKHMLIGRDGADKHFIVKV